MATVCQKCGREGQEGSLFCGGCGQLFVGNGKIKISYGGVSGKAKVTFGQAETPKKPSGKKKGGTTGGTPVLDTYTLEDLEGLSASLSAIVAQYVKRSGKSHVLFGSYPQSVKESSVNILPVKPNEQGYYKGSDGCLYAKVVAHPLQNSYTFYFGQKIVAGQTYFFKVKPIKWCILQEEDGKALVIADQILTCHQFADKNNNYANSSIRQWLNADFVLQAFDEYERIFIRETECSNDVASTGYDSNPNACPATKDFVFLLSVQELMTKKYGFDSLDKDNNDPNRRKIVTDYARAMGTGVNSSPYPGTCEWWTRSSAAFSTTYARPVDAAGNLNRSQTISDHWLGVVPAMWISIGK